MHHSCHHIYTLAASCTPVDLRRPTQVSPCEGLDGGRQGLKLMNVRQNGKVTAAGEREDGVWGGGWFSGLSTCQSLIPSWA